MSGKTYRTGRGEPVTNSTPTPTFDIDKDHDDDDLLAQALVPDAPIAPEDPPLGSTQAGEWALWAHRVGLMVIENQPFSKYRAKQGESDTRKGRRRTSHAIESAWEDTPDANLAILLGHQRDPEVVLIAIDADGRKAALFIANILKDERLATTTPAMMRRGAGTLGVKWLMRMPAGSAAPKSGRLVVPDCANTGHDGVELLSTGRTATLPPSRLQEQVEEHDHSDLAFGGSSTTRESQYEWIVPPPRDLNEIPLCPQSLLDLPFKEIVWREGVLKPWHIIRQSGGPTRTAQDWQEWMQETGETIVSSIHVPEEIRGSTDNKGGGYLTLRRDGGLTLHDNNGINARMGSFFEREMDATLASLGLGSDTSRVEDNAATKAAIKAIEAEEQRANREFPDRFSVRIEGRRERARCFDAKEVIAQAVGCTVEDVENEPRFDGAVHPVLRATQEAVSRAYANHDLTRTRWQAAGFKRRHEKCLALPQLLADYSTGEGLHIGRLCAKDSCIYCGPWRHELRVEAISSLPIIVTMDSPASIASKARKAAARAAKKCAPNAAALKAKADKLTKDADGDDTLDQYLIVGRALGDRPLYLYTVDPSRVGAWMHSWARVARTVSAEIPRINNRRKEPYTRNSRSSVSGVDAWVTFDPKDGKPVTIFSTVEVPRRGEPAGQMVLPEDVRDLVRTLADATVRAVRDDFGNVTRHQVVGKISASHGLYLDPRWISKRADPHGWCRIPVTDLCHPSQTAGRLKKAKLPCTVNRAPDEAVSSVRLPPRTTDQWTALVGLLTKEEPSIEACSEATVEPPHPTAIAFAALDDMPLVDRLHGIDTSPCTEEQKAQLRSMAIMYTAQQSRPLAAAVGG